MATKAKPSALLLAPEAPYPLAGGGALRTASMLHYLAGRYDVDLIVFRQPGAPDLAGFLPPGLTRRVSVIELPPHGRSFSARALRNAGRLARRVPPLVDRFAGFEEQIALCLRGKRYDLGVIEHFWCAPYADQLAASCARTVLDLHNVESILHERCARTEPAPAALAHGVFQRASAELERKWLPRFSCLLAASEPDAAAVRALAPETRVVVYPNAIPSAPAPPRGDENVLVFSGNMEYHPNISAVRFFRQEIWPVLRDRWPDLVWRLVGMNPGSVSRFTSGDPRIEMRGPVEDAVRELARARVAVVPLLAGSGTRLKILEAWAAGLPVVSTSLGAEGLPARDGENLLLSDDPAGFADAVSRALASRQLRERLGAAGRTLLEQEFTWETAWAKLTLECGI